MKKQTKNNTTSHYLDTTSTFVSTTRCTHLIAPELTSDELSVECLGKGTDVFLRR